MGMTTIITYTLLQSEEQEVTQLEGLYEPARLAFSFDTPGWYVLLLLMLALGAWWLYRNYKSNRYRREAVRAIYAYKEAPVEEGILVILKKTAIRVYGRDRVASLYGRQWLDFLDETSGKTHLTNLERDIKEAVTSGTPMDEASLEKLRSNAIKWLRTHGRKL